MTLPYNERQEARRERLEERAENARAEAESRLTAANTIYSGIPLGQPILVGHHSEKRHRRDLARAENNMRKGVEAAKAADELARRAEAVGSAGISSDDPEAVAKLKEKLAMLEAQRDLMKETNKVYAKGFKTNGVAGGVLAVVTAKLATEGEFIKRLQLNNSCGHDKPYPPYAISNIGATIRTTKARIEQLEAQAAAPARDPIVRQTAAGEVRVEENRELNRVQIFFAEKPAESVRAELKMYGFRFAPTEQAWQRQASNGAWYWAKTIVERLP